MTTRKKAGRSRAQENPIDEDASNTRRRFPCPASLAPPRFTVDLSKAPEDRYTHIYPTFAKNMKELPELYDELLSDLFTPSQARFVKRITRVFLRKVYDREETRELRGISKVSQMPMYLLVAFNVLLDLFMGCTSGGVRVRNPDHLSAGGPKSKMLHFRALDWGMDPLRKIVVELDFVKKEGGPVMASSVTYFGYVGVLTGVRPGLSLSLNFRPHHDDRTWQKQGCYFWHLLLVLLGYRRSISSVIRGYLLPKNDKRKDLPAILGDLQDQQSTAAYLIISDGDRTVSMEKDNGSATLEESPDFIVTLNHDVADETQPQALEDTTAADPTTMDATGMAELVTFSVERKLCVTRLLDQAKNDHRASGFPEMPLEEDEIVGWMEGYWIVNDQTHYACIMDPKIGEVIWLQRWLEPFDTERYRRKLEKAQKGRESNAKRRLRAAYRAAAEGEYSLI